jgi:hypothetical protein
MTRITEKLTARWQDIANFLLGVWLVGSPWVLGYADQTAAAWNASVIGLAIALVAASTLVASRVWEQRITAGLGAWLVVSPYILGFATVQAASWNHFVVGVLVVGLTLWAAITEQDIGGVAS